MKRMHFNELFNVYPDGSIEPKYPLQIGGVFFGPGVRFGSGVSFAGIDFSLFKNNFFQVEEQNGIKIIKGIYK